jgi:fumarylpyruvate hydrolase
MKEADERDPPFFPETDRLFGPRWSDDSLPPITDDFQFEIELVVALGREGRDIPIKDTNALIFGYAIGLDMTRRDRQRQARERRLAWEVGKAFDHSAPCSPIHPAARVGVLERDAITLSVNGSERQRGDFSQLIWSVSEIIANLSQQYRLMRGDLIFTGTPAGVGPVQTGDTLAGVIEGLGTLSLTIGEKAK